PSLCPTVDITIDSTIVSITAMRATDYSANQPKELNPATAINTNSNHCTFMLFTKAPMVCAPLLLCSATQTLKTNKKGASNITRTILAITAVSVACALTASPTATTCATSCTVEPVNKPKTTSL